MKMNHLEKETVEQIMEKVRVLVETNSFDPDKMEEIFTLSGVNGEKFLESKNHPLQKDNVNFELDAEKGIRFFDPFNFFTQGIYRDMDGWSQWTIDHLKEPFT